MWIFMVFWGIGLYNGENWWGFIYFDAWPCAAVFGRCSWASWGSSKGFEGWLEHVGHADTAMTSFEPDSRYRTVAELEQHEFIYYDMAHQFSSPQNGGNWWRVAASPGWALKAFECAAEELGGSSWKSLGTSCSLTAEGNKNESGESMDNICGYIHIHMDK